jgi:hypothetical protein
VLPVVSGFVKLDNEINSLKRQLEIAAAKHQFNFHHPKVLQISQQLDSLIVKQMKYPKTE